MSMAGCALLYLYSTMTPYLAALPFHINLENRTRSVAGDGGTCSMCYVVLVLQIVGDTAQCTLLLPVNACINAGRMALSLLYIRGGMSFCFSMLSL